jgi:hypothetical protein
MGGDYHAKVKANKYLQSVFISDVANLERLSGVNRRFTVKKKVRETNDTLLIFPTGDVRSVNLVTLYLTVVRSFITVTHLNRIHSHCQNNIQQRFYNYIALLF